MKKRSLIIFFFTVVVIGAFLVSNKEKAKILFVGDMNFDRHIRKVASNKGGDFIFSCFGERLKKADLVVANLEGNITEYSSVSLGSKGGTPENFVFTFPTTTAKLLKKYNIELVNLGNNHIDDFGHTGFLSTKQYLEEAGVKYFGGMKGEETVYRTELSGEKLSFISYNQFGGDSKEEVAQKIKRESGQGRLVVVYTHWGEEYSTVTSYQKETAKLFANAGARLVVGSHPHIISPSEQISKTFVYYSLGNFIFDQYFEEMVKVGLVLEVAIQNGNFEIFEHQVEMKEDGRTCSITNQNSA